MSSLKERGRSTSCLVVDLSVPFLRLLLGAPSRGVGVQDRPGGSTAERPQVLDAEAARRTLFRAGRRWVRQLRKVQVVVIGCVLQRRFPGWWTGPLWAVGHPFAALGGMECCDKVRGGRDQSVGATTPQAGVMTFTVRAHRGLRAAHAVRLRGARQRMCRSRRP